jgi:hypothetical protein
MHDLAINASKHQQGADQHALQLNTISPSSTQARHRNKTNAIVSA